MWERSVDSAFRNLLRAGVLKNRSRTANDVPCGSPASSTRRILPPAISSTVPPSSSVARVSSSTRATVAFEGQQRIVTHHAAAVVSNLDQLLAARFHLHADTRCASIKRILQQLLQYRRRTLNQLARGDLVSNMLGK